MFKNRRLLSLTALAFFVATTLAVIVVAEAIAGKGDVPTREALNRDIAIYNEAARRRAIQQQEQADIAQNPNGVPH